MHIRDAGLLSQSRRIVCTKSHLIQHFQVKMDTPLAAAVHKENVLIGGEKATVTMKHNKLKTAKTAGNERKALADLRSTYGHVAADLKQKSGMKGNEIKIKRNPRTQGKHHVAAADVFTNKKQLGPRLSKGANLNTKSVWIHEKIKQHNEWAKGMKRSNDEANPLLNQTISEIMASATGIPISELEKPISTDESNLNCFASVQDDACLPGEAMYNCVGCLSSFYPLAKLDDYPLPELKLNDEYEEFSTDNVAEIDGINS